MSQSPVPGSASVTSLLLSQVRQGGSQDVVDTDVDSQEPDTSTHNNTGPGLIGRQQHRDKNACAKQKQHGQQSTKQYDVNLVFILF